VIPRSAGVTFCLFESCKLWRPCVLLDSSSFCIKMSSC